MRVSQKTQAHQGKVNIALGEKESALSQQANIAGTSKTNLARILILDGISRLETGDFRVKPPSIEPAKGLNLRKGGNV
jgi:hypothetical protein